MPSWLFFLIIHSLSEDHTHIHRETSKHTKKSKKDVRENDKSENDKNEYQKEPANDMGETYCFFKISISPALVRSLPCTAVKKAEKSSGGIKRLGANLGAASVEGWPALWNVCGLSSMSAALRGRRILLVWVVERRGRRAGLAGACQ